MRKSLSVSYIFLIVAIVLCSCSSRKGTSSISNSRTSYIKDEAKALNNGVNTNGVKSKDDFSTSLIVQKEKVKIVDGNKSEDYQYFAIVGSFKILENAQNLKKLLVEDGYDPIILDSEKGFYRVSIASGNDEYQIRKKIFEIKVHSSEYSDAWLLVQRYD
jgi:cell division protein FtsN